MMNKIDLPYPALLVDYDFTIIDANSHFDNTSPCLKVGDNIRRHLPDSDAELILHAPYGAKKRICLDLDSVYASRATRYRNDIRIEMQVAEVSLFNRLYELKNGSVRPLFPPSSIAYGLFPNISQATPNVKRVLRAQAHIGEMLRILSLNSFEGVMLYDIAHFSVPKLASEILGKYGIKLSLSGAEEDCCVLADYKDICMLMAVAISISAMHTVDGLIRVSVTRFGESAAFMIKTSASLSDELAEYINRGDFKNGLALAGDGATLLDVCLMQSICSKYFWDFRTAFIDNTLALGFSFPCVDAYDSVLLLQPDNEVMDRLLQLELSVAKPFDGQ